MSEQQHSGYSQLRVRRLVVTLDGLPVSKNELLDIFSGFGRLDIGRKRDDCIIQDDNDNPSVWIVCCDSYAEADNIRQRADRFLVRGTLLRVQFENVESRHLYVSGFIGYDTAQALETAMAAVFSRFGRIRSMRPLLPSNGGPIEYDDVSSAMAALAAMQDYPHQGRRVTVETRSAAVAARTAAKYAIIQRHRDRPASTASAASSAASSSLSNGHHDGGGYRGPLIVDSRHQQGSSRSPPRGSLSMHRSDETFRPAVVDYGRRVVRHVDLDDTRDRDRERDREPRYHQQQQQRHRYSPQASSSSAVAAAAARDPVGSAIVQMSTSTASKDPVGAAIVQMSTTTASSVIMSDAATPIKTGGSSSVLASIMSPKAAIAVSQADRFDRFNDNRNGGGDDDDYDSGYQSGGGGFYEQGQIPDNQNN